MLSKLKPSPSMIVALIALFVAMGGSAYAVSKISGSKLKNRSVPAKKLKLHTLTGNEIDLSKLGTVPSAASALALGGLGPGAYVSALDVRYSTQADGCLAASPGADAGCNVSCPSGEFAISGGVFTQSTSTLLYTSRPFSSIGDVSPGHPPVGWSAGIHNGDTISHNLTVYAICVRVGSATVTEEPEGPNFG